MIIKAKGKVIGEYFPDEKVFVKHVQGHKHLFIKLDAWGIDAKYFNSVLLPLNIEIRVVDGDDGKVYRIKAQEFAKNMEYKHFKPHGAQVFLSRTYWNPQKTYEVKVAKQPSLI